MTRRTIRRVIAATIVVASLAASASAGEVLPGREYDIKAGFLFNFARMVTYPEHAFTTSADDLRIEIIGHDCFDGALDRLVAGKMIAGRRVVIVYSATAPTRRSHIVFVSKSEQKRLPTIVSALNGAATLTVSDIDNFAINGGMIGFVMNEGMVRFAINRAAAARARLRLDSRLLALARLVGGDQTESNPPMSFLEPPIAGVSTAILDDLNELAERPHPHAIRVVVESGRIQ